MRSPVLKLTVIISLIFTPFCSNAWGVLGHRIVGEIADKYISNTARKQIKSILGNESIAMSSNWMDFIKSDPSLNLGNWHYLNIKGGVTQDSFYHFLEKDTATNIYTRINFVTTELKNKMLHPDLKARYLKILIHLAGDVHQPLHVGRPDDQGGNRIRLMWFNDNVNLHQIWDEKLVNFQQLSYTEYATVINFVSKDQKKVWQNEPVKQWIWDSYLIAEGIYKDVKAEEKLGYSYNFKYVSVVNDQLLKGGVHLAGLLNNIFR